MKYVADLPWKLVTDEGTKDENELDAQLFAVDETEFKCEMAGDAEAGLPGAIKCHEAPVAIGCSDMHAPKFCLNHYFSINNAKSEEAKDGLYKIVPVSEAR